MHVRVIGELAATPIPERLAREVIKLVTGGTNEPVGHLLFREAWSQRTSNPTSAYIVGWMSAEIGFKECVADLAPGMEWLIMNLPSPPLPTMIKRLLPTLPARLMINGAVLLPPQPVMKQIVDAMQRRNDLIHQPGSVTLDETQDFLEAVRDFLWQLDYYRGNQWAVNHLSVESHDALGFRH